VTQKVDLSLGMRFVVGEFCLKLTDRFIVLTTQLYKRNFDATHFGKRYLVHESEETVMCKERTASGFLAASTTGRLCILAVSF
jgi:hypothetical protein